jgi:hypothetical protein
MALTPRKGRFGTIEFDAKNPMAVLEVKANLSASVETARTQRLMAGCGYCRNTSSGKIASWTENGASKRIAVTFDAAGISADVKPFEILGLRSTKRDQSKGKYTGSR